MPLLSPSLLHLSHLPCAMVALGAGRALLDEVHLRMVRMPASGAAAKAPHARSPLITIVGERPRLEDEHAHARRVGQSVHVIDLHAVEVALRVRVVFHVGEHYCGERTERTWIRTGAPREGPQRGRSPERKRQHGPNSPQPSAK